ncbi:MAG: DUF4129 domain-containing protein [SAR202 cluster bacterium]|nr:DUF4129 domain-containing protein [SAR202 cluster bacterium]
MNLVQDRLVLAATAVLESVWLYALFAVLGLLMAQNGSPLSWIVAVAILGLSTITARTLGAIIMPPAMPYAIQMAAGAIVIYLALGAQVQIAGESFELGWISNLWSDTIPVNYGVTVGLGGFFGALLWWRGGRLASVEYPVEHLNKNFRIGLIFLALAAVVDVFHGADLKTFPLMFVYFAAGLTGLSLAHLLPASQRTAGQKAWPRIISAVIAVVIVAGLLFSLLQRGVLTYISEPLGFLLSAFATVIFFVFIIPMVYIIEFLMRGLFSLISKVVGDPEAPTLEASEGVGEMLMRLQEESGDTGPSMLLQAIEWTLLAIIVVVVLIVLARSFRRRIRWRRTDQEGIRESVAEDAGATVDFAKLLWGLVPDRFRKRKGSPPMRLPDDEPGIVDVFRLYFGMLMQAEKRGSPRPANQTPAEYASTLEQLFPQNLVRSATAAFVRACYGHKPAPREQIEEMRSALEEASTGP